MYTTSQLYPNILNIMASSNLKDTSPIRSSSKPTSTSTTTLSEYLHDQLGTVIAHNRIRSPKEKIEVVQRINDFLKNPSDDLFSPIISDVHLIMKDNNGGSGSGIGNSEGSPIRRKTDMHKDIQNSSIQLPPIDWNQHFRKGYSMLMWVRFHSENETKAEADADDAHNYSSSNHQQKLQILYRFATSDTPSALGIQASLYRDTSLKPNGKVIPSILRIENLRPLSPFSPSKMDSNTIYNSSVTAPILIPDGKWTLIGIQHSHPYLKPPMVNIALNGEEVHRDELAYPSLHGGDSGGIMKDNIILSNLPGGDPGNVSTSMSSYESSHLNIETVDFAGFGLFNENVPALIQGIVAEHGPCPNADGVIPSVPPTVQNRETLVMGGERNSIQKKKGGVMSGPFGQRAEVPVGRTIGIPLCAGVMLSSDGKYQGEILLQKLLSKLVIGLNASNAIMPGGGGVFIPVTMGCSIGLLGESNIIGLVQPKDPFGAPGTPTIGKKRRQKGSAEIQEEISNIAKFTGCVDFYHATQDYLVSEKKKGSLISTPIPSYSIPSSTVVDNVPIPSFLGTYSSLNAVVYILQAFRSALPPPGYSHNLQMKFYHDSFDHLNDLLVHKGGEFASKLIELFAATLSLGGRIREEILHSGSLHTLATLLRRVLLRASRLGMFSKSNSKSENERLWQTYSTRETPADELLDMHAIKQSSPSHIPELITKACCLVISSCCGPTEEVGTRWKRSPLASHIRRGSDIALTAVFGFSFDMDLWGGDLCACSAIFKEVTDRYCSDGFESGVSTEITEKFDNSLGRILRFEMNIQCLLDTIRIRFGEEMIITSTQSPKRRKAHESFATSLSRLLYVLLKFSLSSSKTISQGEHDVTTMVNALTDCHLGSIVSHAILTALRDILIYCETFPAIEVQSKLEGKVREASSSGPNADAVSSILFNHTSRQGTIKDGDHHLRLRRMKSDIVERLARNLIIGQFHDVVAPLLLSRTFFDGRSGMNNGDANTIQLESSEFYWQAHWRLVLWLFTVSQAKSFY